jgi:cytochrome c556
MIRTMLRVRNGMLALCASAALVLAAPQIAAAEADIKTLMGDNFGGLQTILFGLISANYGAVPDQADIIRDHAEQLSGMIPASAAQEKTQFLAYANNLAAHATDMKTIAQELMKHDAERGISSTDYLREALASHYGGMVTMCVACHNRYRPLPAP